MKVKRMVFLGVLTSAALCLSFAESFLDLTFLAPGIKPGLANIPVIMLVCLKHKKSATAVGLCRITLASLLFGTPVTFLYAFCGLLFSFMAMCICTRLTASVFLSGVFGGIFHNVGQLLGAVLCFGNLIPLSYLPIMVPAGAVCGALTGLISVLLLKNKAVIKLFDF